MDDSSELQKLKEQVLDLAKQVQLQREMIWDRDAKLVSADLLLDCLLRSHPEKEVLKTLLRTERERFLATMLHSQYSERQLESVLKTVDRYLGEG